MTSLTSIRKYKRLLSQPMFQPVCLLRTILLFGGFLGGSVAKNLLEMRVWSLGPEDPLEEDMAINSSILAWKTPRTGEPGGLPSMGSQRVRHDWALRHIFLFKCDLKKVTWSPLLLIWSRLPPLSREAALVLGGRWAAQTLGPPGQFLRRFGPHRALGGPPRWQCHVILPDECWQAACSQTPHPLWDDFSPSEPLVSQTKPARSSGQRCSECITVYFSGEKNKLLLWLITAVECGLGAPLGM